MKLIIDIPEKIYNDIKSKNEHGIIFNAVKNGTPLPKGHGDLIDRNKLGVMPIDTTDIPSDKCLMVYLADDVDFAPIIIEAESEVGE